MDWERKAYVYANDVVWLVRALPYGDGWYSDYIERDFRHDAAHDTTGLYRTAVEALADCARSLIRGPRAELPAAEARLVCGSRDWADGWAIGNRIKALLAGTLVIQGEQRGADVIARNHACLNGYPVIGVPYIGALGRAGGPVRNQLMLDLLLWFAGHGCAIGVLAFHLNLSASKGTRDMVGRAEAARVAVELIAA